ncbi:cation diffusion facilitator family transporter [Streptococcus macacae]|uniref:Cation diffusion facilitator family transporter n=1 Tax=Streptococcus macacae NCTC 11558 TaxID=764298 RepID=G5JVI1_9STRE|nr:cation diffusion facilitator family transporter [Streptococcus macacae]EHJ52871.1 cation diffusion facilitator family transporter [Streptococcus macacae NCTC 11558]SUN78576.1 cation efflux transporter [Streptococcus macacae NCTC 11558]
MSTPEDNLKLARRGPILSISVYLILSLAKLLSGYFLHSASLTADGFNNVSDIVANVTLLIGLYLASKPADSDHKFGHWKIEDLASLITSFIMFTVGFQVLLETVNGIIHDTRSQIDPLGAFVGLISALIMFSLYLYNKNLSKKLNSSALMAAAKDNLSDALTSLGTTVAIVASSFNLVIIDKITAVIITVLILKTAYDIFMASAFSLSDGFDDKQLQEYEKAILEIPKISAVKSQRGRTYGSNVYLDLVLEMNPDLSVYESHTITERVENLLHDRFNIYDIDIHVEPAAIPEDEKIENVHHKLYKYEKTILSKIPDYDSLLADNFILIDEAGQVSTKKEFLNSRPSMVNSFNDFKMISVSQKTKLITYELNEQRHTSLWRRHERWQVIYHQISPIINR